MFEKISRFILQRLVPCGKFLRGLLVGLAIAILPVAAFTAEDSGVTQDEQGNIYIPPGYEFTPVSKENLGDKVLAAVSLFSTKSEAGCYKGVRICKGILKLEPSNGFVINNQNNVKGTFLPAVKKNLGEKLYDKMWRNIASIKYVKGEKVIYDNSAYRFTFSYPVDWDVVVEIENNREKNNACIQIISPVVFDDAGGKIRPSVGIIAEKISSGTDIEKYYKLCIKRQEEMNVKIIWSEEYKNTGKRAVFESEQDGKQFKGELAFFVKNGYGYFLNFTSKPEVYESTKWEFDGMLDNFEIK